MLMPTVGSVSVGGARLGRNKGDAPGSGPGGKCVCPKCEHTISHKIGEPCNERKCPKCDTTMTREIVKLSELDIAKRLQLARSRLKEGDTKDSHSNIKGSEFVLHLGQSGDNVGIIKTKGTRHYQYYDVKTQVVRPSHKEARSVVMRSAYSKKGDYIGTAVFAFRMVNVHGIRSFEKAKPNDNICTIGYSPGNNKWYGWSHRGIHGYGIGSQYKKARAVNLTQAKRFAAAFADSIS